VNLEDTTLGFDIRKRELNFSDGEVRWSEDQEVVYRSILPGRMRAGSKVSILFVAMMTFTSPESEVIKDRKEREGEGTSLIEPIKLIEEFQHRSLDLACTTGGGFVTTGQR
jgi:hypothetical protein